jgi:hypothetical protein
MKDFNPPLGKSIQGTMQDAGPLVLATMTMLFLSFPLLAQGNLGRILGTITDQSGGVVAGATVTVLDQERGTARTLTTDQAGEYNAPNLTPGMYTVRAETKGFKTAENGNILVEVGKEVRIDLSLQPGEQTEKITVSEAVPLVETTNAVLGGTLSHDMIIDLPLNGRNYQNLLMLRPGTIVNPGGNERQSTNGLRGTDNVYLVDGLANDEIYTGLSMLNAPTFAGDVGVILPVDSIQEFNTSANNKAELGLKPGGVVSVGVKSGTNTIGGSAFAFGRGTGLTAKNYFNTPVYGGCLTPVNNQCPPTPISLEQWGATLGGPIKKDKLFWFAAYEQQLYTVGQALPNTTPIVCAGGSSGCQLTATNTAQSFPDALQFLVNNGYTIGTNQCTTTPTTNGCTAVSPTGATISNAKNVIAANSLLVSGCTIAPITCTGGLFVPNAGQAGTSFQPNLLSNNRSDNGVAKVTYHLNERNSFEGTVFSGTNNSLFNDANTEARDLWESQLYVRSTLVAGSWTWVPNSNWVNEARVGYARYIQKFDSNDFTTPASTYTFNGQNYSLNTGVTNPAFNGFPILTIANFGLRLGGNWPKYIGPDADIQFLDHISLLHGKHAFKYGAEVNRYSFTGAATTNARGNLSFSNSASQQPLEDFFTGVMSTGGNAGQILVGGPFRNVHNWHYSAFFQDDWRIKPRVIINLGVRYEVSSVIKENQGRIANWVPNVGPVQVGQTMPGSTSQYKEPYGADLNNVSPRLGLAWDIRGNGKTVLRAGGSLIYSTTPYISLLGPNNGLGLGTIGSGDSFQVGGVTTKGNGNIAVASVSVPAANMNWNASTATNGITIFPTTTLNVVCGDGLASGTITNGVALTANDAATCSLPGVDQHLATPYVSTWNLDIQRAITNKISLDIAYVGTHGTKLLGLLDLNQPPVGTGWTGPTPGACPGAACGQPVGLSQLAKCVNATPATATSLSASSCNNPSTPAEQFQRPYTISCPVPIGLGQGSNPCIPYEKLNMILSNIDQSNYNSLQVAVTGRPDHGLSYNVAYTFSHALDYASSNFGITVAPDTTDPRHLQYGPSAFDRRHILNISTTYQIPGKKSPLQLLEGWALNSIVSLRGGTPWSPILTTPAPGADLSGAGDGGSYWNFYGNPDDFPATGPMSSNIRGGKPFFYRAGTPAMATDQGSDSLHFYAINNPDCVKFATAQVGPSVPLTVGGPAVPTNGLTSLENLGCYESGSSVLIPPAFGTWSQNGRGIFRGPSFKIWDVSITKETKIRERITATFRAEFFNILNRPTFNNITGSTASPNSNPTTQSPPNQFGSSNQTLDAGGQNPVVGAGGPRSIQLGLKLTF